MAHITMLGMLDVLARERRIFCILNVTSHVSPSKQSTPQLRLIDELQRAARAQTTY